MKNIAFWLVFPAFLFLLCNCSDDNKEPEVIENLTLSTSSLTFVAAGESHTFTITSNAKWEIEKNSADTWYTVTPQSGEGNMEITVKAEENAEGKELKSQLKIKTKTAASILAITQSVGELYFPLLTITTENSQPITSKETYINATLVIQSRDNKGAVIEKIFDQKTEIRGRGNSTWGMEKKPYRLKLNKSVEVLGMPKNKHWVLLANYSDKTLMRNELAFEISRRMGFVYTPRMKYVDVQLNGNYIGNYMLGEHIRVDENRVNIAELKATDSNITGGYLLEIDSRAKDDPTAVWFKTQKAGMEIAISRPEDLPTAQIQYITNHIQKVENTFYASNIVTELPKVLDLKSFIDYLLLNELSRNVDGNLRLSTFMYKQRDDDKIYFGPVWDYDIAFGNVDYDNCEKIEGWHTSTAPWYAKFLAQPQFKAMVVDRWKELRRGQLKDMEPFITKTSKKMNLSQTKNFQRWDILNKRVWPNPIVTGSYSGEVTYLKTWLKNRMNWMDTQLK